MLGAIAGDVIGSVFEVASVKEKDFPLLSDLSRYTDDTVLTIAVADAIMAGSSYASTVREYALRYPDAGYGSSFFRWANSDAEGPYNSWGNGSAMRVSPVGWVSESVEDLLAEAEHTAAITHNHPEGIKGAQAVALAVWLARNGASKSEIRDTIEGQFGYDLGRSVDDIREIYGFDVSCQGSVPESLISFLESEDFEDAVRNAISLGGDADTMACIAGAVAEAYYGPIPAPLERDVLDRLAPELSAVALEFRDRYCRS